MLLRGDTDALPVDELTGVEHASGLRGRMHGCGHDPRTAGLVGAATLLADGRESLQGDVVFMFQPGEEGHNGAGAMIDEGVLNAAGKPLDAAFALHVSANRLPGGWVASRPGTVMRASDVLRVTVRGEGGHGSGSAPREGPGAGRLRDGDRTPELSDAHLRHLRPGGGDRRAAARRYAAERRPGHDRVRGHRTQLLRGRRAASRARARRSSSAPDGALPTAGGRARPVKKPWALRDAAEAPASRLY